jgi:hypothetical protein
MRNNDVLDQIFKGLGDAITDIREKVVEEPFFGRALSDRESTAMQWPQAREPEPADTRDSAPQTPDRDQAADREMDR